MEAGMKSSPLEAKNEWFTLLAKQLAKKSQLPASFFCGRSSGLSAPPP